MPDPADIKGFTLIEILVALAVLGLVVVAVLKNNSAMIDNSIYLRDKTLAHWVATNKAAEMELSPDWIKLGTEHGNVTFASRIWYWTVIGEKTPDEAVRKATIEIREEEKAPGALASLVIFMGK